MKKKKIISSLMLTGIVLSSINPMVVLADETAETQSAQNTPSSQAATNNTSTSEDSLSQVGLDTQSSVLAENSEQTKNTENLTTSNDDLSKHVLGNRPADDVSVNGNALGVHDQIRVDRIKETKNGNTYTVDIDGSLMAETNSHTMVIDYATDTKHTVVEYKPNGHHPVTINSFSSNEVVRYIVIQVEKNSASGHLEHMLDATYHFTADELPEDTKPVINASDKTINVGDIFDPMAGVTATDAEDGNLTSKIQVISNHVDTTRAGSYQVTYRVTDSNGNTVQKTITVTVKSNEKPVINASGKTIKVGDTFDPKAGVTATDAEDGNLTSRIQVIGNTVDTTKAGSYEVIYKVTDSDGNSTVKTITVTVKENAKPVIDASDKTIKVGDTFDPKAGVTATDTEDGDLTSKIEVKENTVDTTKAGEYQVTYTVTDADGNTVEKTIKVTVKENNKPVINASDKTLKVGDTFDPKAGVTATDAEDGDLTSKIEVKENTVDTTKAGSYQVTYTVTDADGNTVEKTIKVTVKENNKPVINASDKTMIVGSTFDPKAGVTATDAEDGDLTSKIEVKENTVDTTKAGNYQVTYAVTDADGNTTEKTITVTVIANQGTITPDAYDLSNNHRKITGSYDGDVAEVKVELNGVLLPGNGTLKDGEFEYYIGGHITTTKDQVFVIAYDKEGNQLDKKQVTIKQGQTQGTVTPDEYDLSNNHRRITGSYDGDVAKVQVELNGEVLPGNGTLKDGKFEYYIGGHITSTKDQVFVIAYDEQGKQLDKKQVTIKQGQTQGTVTPDGYDLSNNHRKITGSYDGDVAKVQVELNGEVLPGNGTLKDGKFEYYIGGHITSTKDQVFVIAYDEQGKQLDKKQVSVTKSVTEGTVKPNEFSLAEDNKITGSYSGDVAEIDLQVNGTILPGKGSFKDGSFSYYVGKNVTSEKDEVYVIALDKKGQVLDKEKVDLEGTAGTITVDSYKLNTNKITGTFTGDVAYFKVKINDNELSKGGTLSGNKFSYYVGHSITHADDKVVITAFDKNNKQLDQKQLTIAAE